MGGGRCTGTIGLKVGLAYYGPLPAALIEGARSGRGNSGSGFVTSATEWCARVPTARTRPRFAVAATSLD